MKKISVFFLILVFFTFIPNSYAEEDDVYDVILFWGQSNMVGYAGIYSTGKTYNSSIIQYGEDKPDVRFQNKNIQTLAKESGIDAEILENYVKMNHVNIPFENNTVFDFKYFTSSLTPLTSQTTSVGEDIYVQNVNGKISFTSQKQNNIISLQKSYGTNMAEYFAYIYSQKTNYNAKTNRKVVIVLAANGGEEIAHFLPHDYLIGKHGADYASISGTSDSTKVEQYIYEATIEKYNAAIQYLNNKGYKIGNRFYVAFQGEEDAKLINNSQQTKSKYQKRFQKLHELFTASGLVDGKYQGLGLQFGVLVETSRASNKNNIKGINDIHSAQETLIKNNTSIVRGSSFSFDHFVPKIEEYSGTSQSHAIALEKARLSTCYIDVSSNNEVIENSIHFTSAGLSQIGKESAERALSGLKTTVTFYKNDGSSSKAQQVFLYGNQWNPDTGTGNRFGYNVDGNLRWGNSGQFGQWNRVGYKLLGWNRKSTDDDKIYDPYNRVTDDWVAKNSPNVNLYAIWEAKTLTCSNGKYLRASDATCQSCPTGSYCEGGTYTFNGSDQGKKTCPTGYTSDVGAGKQSDCYINVSGGYYKSQSTGITRVECRKGSISVDHKSYYGTGDSCSICAAGTTSSGHGKSSCDAICSQSNVKEWNVPSWKSDNTVSDVCSIKTCSNGYNLYKNECYAPKLCSNGKYLRASDATCQSCPAGSYCEGGTYTFNGSDQGKKTCPTGYTSDVGARKQSDCYINVSGGYYKSQSTGITRVECRKGSISVDHKSYYGTGDSCSICAAGTTSSGHGKNSCDAICSQSNVKEWNVPSWKSDNTVSDVCSIKTCSNGYNLYKNECLSPNACAMGEYYRGNDSTCQPCPVGSYCEGGTYTFNGSDQGKKSCPAGYTSDVGAGKQSDCYINVSGGYYKSQSTGITRVQCRQGSTSVDHKSYYGTGDSCSICAAGTTSSGHGKNSCDAICSQSNVKEWNVPSWKSDNTVSDVCSIKTCSNGYNLYKNDCSSLNTCAIGEYYRGNDATCQSCPAGSYCEGGTYTFNGSDQGKKTCPAGYTSDVGAGKQSDCYINVSGGYYKSQSTGTSKAQCRQGSISVDHKSYYGTGDSCSICAAGTTSSGHGKNSCDAICSQSNVKEWNVPSWRSDNTVSDVCSIKNCDFGFINSNNTCNNIEVTVSYDISDCPDKKLKVYDRYGSLCTPTKDNYVFDGWYKSKDSGEKIEQSTVLETTSNVVLYSRYTSLDDILINNNYKILPNLGYMELKEKTVFVSSLDYSQSLITKIYRGDNEIKSGFMATGYKYKVYQSNNEIGNYDIIVRGDVVGNGIVNIADVSKLYQYLKGRIQMEDVYIKAGKVTNSNDAIRIGDVSKLYQYLKGRISDL